MAKSKKQNYTYFDVDAFLSPLGKNYKKGGKLLANDGIKLPDYKEADQEITRNFLDDIYQRGKIAILDRDTEDVKMSQKFGIESEMGTIPKYVDPKYSTTPDKKQKQPLNFNPGNALLGALSAIDFLLPGQKITNHHLVKPGLAYNPNPYGTGSQALMKHGGKMSTYPDGGKIKKTGIGRAGDVPQALTLEADRTMGGTGAISPLGQKMMLTNTIQNAVLQRPQLTPEQLRQAQLQQGYFKDGDWFPNPQHLQTGARVTNQELQLQNPYAVNAQNQAIARTSFKKGGTIEPVSYNPYDGGTQLAMGASHEQGGINMQYGGQIAEVEGGEPMAKDSMGNLNIFGDMVVPGTKKKFKTVVKEIAKEEERINKQLHNVTKDLDKKDPNDPYDKLAFNSAMVTKEGADKKLANLARSKEMLAAIQDTMLAAESYNKTMKKGGKLFAKEGAKVEPGPYDDMIKKAAEKYGIESRIFRRILNQESGIRVKNKRGQVVTSSAGALGIAQFMPKTAELYGISKEMLTSDKPEDVEKVLDASAKHFHNLLKQYNNDNVLALAAYNGGGGAIEHVKKALNKKKITGDEWYSYMNKRHKEKNNQKEEPNAWHNQTFNYVKNIARLTDEEFEKEIPNFRKTFGYNDADVDIPEVPYNDPLGVPTNRSGKKTPNRDADYSKRKGLTPSDPNNDIILDPNNELTSSSVGNNLDMTQILPEILSIATNAQDPVPVQQYNPQLFQDYRVSFEDRLNANNATFRAATQKLGYDPSTISQLAAQQYAANSSVLAEEFRVNQGIQNEVTNKNIGLLNEAQLKNLSLADQQMVRQAQAKANTKSQLNTSLNSITSKIMQNKLENLRLITNEALFDFRYKKDDKGRINGIWRDPKAGNAPLNLETSVGTTQPTTYDPNNVNQVSPATSTTVKTDGFGKPTSFSYNTPSFMKQQQERLKTLDILTGRARDLNINLDSPNKNNLNRRVFTN